MNATIQQKEQEIADKQAQIDESFSLLQQRLRAIFKSGNMSGLQMLLDTNEYADYLIKSKMIERISQNDQDLMDSLEVEMQQISEEKSQVEAQRAEVERQEQEIASLKAQADQKKIEMDSLYSQVNAVVKQLQNNIQLYGMEQLKKKQQEEEELNKQISDLTIRPTLPENMAAAPCSGRCPPYTIFPPGLGIAGGAYTGGSIFPRERFPFTDKMSWRRPTEWLSMPTRPIPGAADTAITS